MDESFTTTSPKAIDFYFDFASPYGYLASHLIDSIAEQTVWRPILLGIIFKTSGMRAMVDQPLRGPYFKHDIQRYARQLKIPLIIPPLMPVSAVSPSRAYYWALAYDPSKAKPLCQTLFHLYWVEGRISAMLR